MGRNQHRQLQPGGNFEGLALVTFDLNDESAVTRNPFHMNMDKGPGIIDGGMVCVDGADRYWFACNPDQDDTDTEGLCWVPTTVMPTPPKIATIPWSEKTYTIVSVQCSAALKAPVVLAQKISQSDGKVDTRVYMVDAESSGDWPMIVDLGPAWSDLHQATISGNGRFMMVNMGIGSSEDYPQPNLVTVDLVAKQMVNQVKLKATKEYTILAPIAC